MFNAFTADQMNQQMVDRMIALGALWSPSLIAAFRATPRHQFLKHVYLPPRHGNEWQKVITREQDANNINLLYSDRALITKLTDGPRPGSSVPISSSSQPSLMAQMLEDLALQAGQRVLEVGTGTGYNAALLAHIVGPQQVWSIDVDHEVITQASAHLQLFADRHVQLAYADGRCGFPEAAPYDRIIVTAAAMDLEPAWLEQLALGGLLLVPLTLAPGLAYVVCGSVTDRIFEGHLTRAAYFMPLRSEGESGRMTEESPQAYRSLKHIASPWSGWFDHKQGRLSWIKFLQSVAFFAWLNGYRVAHDTTSFSEPTFCLRTEEGSAVCWLGEHEWRVTNDEGCALGERLWRDFLDAGGPWPTEFRFRASPDGLLPRTTDRDVFQRQGPRCHWLWELPERRERISGI